MGSFSHVKISSTQNSPSIEVERTFVFTARFNRISGEIYASLDFVCKFLFNREQPWPDAKSNAGPHCSHFGGEFSNHRWVAFTSTLA